MPLLDFKCNACGTVFEDIQSSDTKRIACKFCGDGIAEVVHFQQTKFAYSIQGDNSASTRPKEGK
jgi:putative FmdB family regulatory protein